MTDFLYFRNMVAKINNGELLFSIMRLRHWLDYEYSQMYIKSDEDDSLLKHLNISHILWDEYWWRSLREKSRSRLFPKIRKYI